MPTLLTTIDSLRRRLNRWETARAVGWWGAAVLAAILSLLAIDAAVRSPEASWRWLQFGVLVGVGLAAARQYFMPLRSSPTNVTVARLIERQLPDLRDRLSSAVLFLEERERSAHRQHYDSPQLRERVILETAADCADRDFTQLLSPRSLRRAWLACGGCAAILLGLGIARPDLLEIALLRQVAPWRETHWPRAHELYLETDSLRLARGETFQAAVLDHRGELPRDLILQIRSLASAAASEKVREEVPLAWQPNRVPFRRDNVQHDFEFRVVGGDDQQMAWTRVEVLEPARLEELAFQIIPPAHTRWPTYQADAPLLVLPGSSLEISGRATRSLAKASIEYDGQKTPLQVLADQRTFRFPGASEPALQLTTSGKLHFEFIDAEGIASSSEVYEVRIVADQPPAIEWDTRAGEQLLTPGGEWNFTAVVRDDVAVDRVELILTRLDDDTSKPDTAQAFLKELYLRSAATMPDPLEPTQLEALRRGRWPEERRPWSSAWRFPAPLPAVGSRWQAQLRLVDSAGQEALSEPRTLKIVSPDELSARMANHWNELLRDLTALGELQQSAQRQIIEALDQEQAIPQPLDTGRVAAGIVEQRQIAQELTRPSAKIPRKLATLESEFKANQLEQTSSGQRLTVIQNKLRALRRGELTPLEEAMSAWEQAAAAGLPAAEQQRLLQTLIPLQAAVQQRLREIIELLDQQTNWAQLERTLQTLQQAQQKLREESRQNENLALGRTVDQLTAGEQALLNGLAQRQTNLAEQLTTWQNSFGKLRLDAANGTLAAEGLRNLFLQRQPVELMRRAGTNLSLNRTGQATQQQSDVLAVLAEALELLRTGKSSKPSGDSHSRTNQASQNKTTPPAQQLAELRQLQAQLTALEQRQAKLNQQTAQFAALGPDQENPTKNTTATLAAQQQSLHAEVAKLATELDDQQSAASPLTFQLQRIAAPMQAAAAALNRRDPGDSTQREQQIALERLRLLLMAFSSRDIPPPKEPGKEPNKENPQQTPKLRFTPRQVTELRLIRVLQLELTARTAAAADAAKAITEPTAAEQRAAAQIAAEQEKLREMLEQLIRETMPATEVN
jgi:hypothetical protein